MRGSWLGWGRLRRRLYLATTSRLQCWIYVPMDRSWSASAEQGQNIKDVQGTCCKRPTEHQCGGFGPASAWRYPRDDRCLRRSLQSCSRAWCDTQLRLEPLVRSAHLVDRVVESAPHPIRTRIDGFDINIWLRRTYCPLATGLPKMDVRSAGHSEPVKAGVRTTRANGKRASVDVHYDKCRNGDRALSSQDVGIKPLPRVGRVENDEGRLRPVDAWGSARHSQREPG